MTADGSVSLRDYLDGRLKELDGRLSATELRIMQTTQERWGEHARQHADERAGFAELKADFREAMREVRGDISALRVSQAKVGAVVAAAVVVAGLIVRFL